MRSVKGGVHGAVGGSCLTEVEIRTCLSDIVIVANSLPLTFVGTDVENKNPLTPTVITFCLVIGIRVFTV